MDALRAEISCLGKRAELERSKLLTKLNKKALKTDGMSL